MSSHFARFAPIGRYLFSFFPSLAYVRQFLNLEHCILTVFCKTNFSWKYEIDKLNTVPKIEWRFYQECMAH